MKAKKANSGSARNLIIDIQNEWYNLYMSNSATIEITVNSRLLKEGEKKASILGYSSVAQMLQSFLTKVVKEPIPDEYVRLSPNAKKRWEKIDADIKAGRNIYEFSDPEEALRFLHSSKR